MTRDRALLSGFEIRKEGGKEGKQGKEERAGDMVKFRTKRCHTMVMKKP